MPEIKYTADQQKMLDSCSQNLLVSASAGSGKTATLIQKVIGLIEQGKSLDEMLIITFTESASLEMKSRLRERLNELSLADKKYVSQLDKLSTCNISTLHAFCSKIIRKYFYMIDAKPNYVVLDENNSQFLKIKALDKTIRQYSKSGDIEFNNLVSMFGGRDFEGLKKSVLTYQNFLASLDDRKLFLDNISTSGYNQSLKDNQAYNLLNKNLVSNFKYITKICESFLLKALQQHATKMQEFLSKSIEATKTICCEDFVQNCKLLKNLSLPRTPTGKLSDEDLALKSDFAVSNEKIREKIKNLKKKYPFDNVEKIKNALSQTARYVEKFNEVQKAYEDWYCELKLNRNGLDFNDLEKYLLEPLKIDEVKKDVSFEYVFVDEYQDINSVQENIILNVCALSGKKVMVGDVKQSIYRFRNSTPEIFVSKSKLYNNNGAFGELVTLNDNFRSDGTILNFVNRIFEKCMDIDFGGIDYVKDGMLKPHTIYKNVSDLPKVEIDVFHVEKEDDDGPLEYDDVYSVLDDRNTYKEVVKSYRREGSFIADKIEQIVGKKMIYDAKTNSSRIVEYKDITILCRGNEYLKDVASVLFDRHIPISTSMVSNVYKQQDVDRLISLLKVINNFHDDVSLAVVMNSLFDISFDELSQIRSSFYDKRFFYDAVKECAISSDFEENLKQKIDAFIHEIADLRAKLQYKSIYEILSDYCEKGYYNYVLSLPDGENRLRFVKDFVDSFEGKDYNYDLTGYLDYAKNYAQNNKIRTQLSSGENCVQLSTIHASKGLEYPIVFLIGCGKRLVQVPKFNEAIYSKDMGVGFCSFDFENHTKSSNVAREGILLNNKYADMAEELRLLYVALTRAKNHLFIIGQVNLSKMDRISTPQEAHGAGCYFEWILSCLSENNFNGLTSNKKSVKQKIDKEEVPFNIQQLSLETKSNEEISLEKIKQGKEDKELTLLMQTRKSNSQNIALKNSVSSLLMEHASPEESLNYAPKRLSLFEGGIDDVSASELGTIYHKIMEQVDYSAPFSKQDFDDIIARLNLDKKYVKHINFEKISRCVDSIKSFGVTKVQKELPFISYIPYKDIFGGEIEEKVIVQGVADLIVHAGDKNYLVDFKTTKANSADQLVEKYYVQLKLYKMCLERALNSQFDGTYIYSYVMDKLIKVF